MICSAKLPRALEILKNFKDLPDEANVRVSVVAALLGCSEVTVWRKSREGKLPQPRRLSNKLTIWNVGELRKTMTEM
jgi:predicted DNA-binding transcriptional regulator AlpA